MDEQKDYIDIHFYLDIEEFCCISEVGNDGGVLFSNELNDVFSMTYGFEDN